MRILIVGVTSSVGSEVARSLVARGADVRALCRSPKSALPEGVTAAPGDLEDPRSLAAALEGIDAAFYVSPHHEREEALGRAFVDACEAAGVKRLVFSAAFHFDSKNRVASAFLRWLTGILGAHYRPKLRVEARVRRSRLQPVILLPTNFFQNDDLFRDELLAGSYPLPLGARPVNAIDTRDIGDAAARALLDPSVAPGVYPLVGSDAPSGEERAALWSAALGQPVRYAGDDLDAWERVVMDRMVAAKRNDFKKTLAILQRWGIPVTEHHLADTTRLLGRAPRRFADYARERAAEWQNASLADGRNG